jgi:hypothetical protein
MDVMEFPTEFSIAKPRLSCAMKPDPTRILAALNRNWEEANNAILKLTAFNQLNKIGFSDTEISFFSIVDQALYNDILAGAIRIFDDHKEAGSLWYIVRCKASAATQAAHECGINLPQLRKIVPKLLHIRNKTHFHIDRRALDNPSAVWTDADMSGQELAQALYDAAHLLARIKQNLYGGELEQLTPYDGSDAQQIIRAYQQTID